jgi:hypothetical protein
MSRNPRNPYAGLSTDEAYRKFHWGTNPTHKKSVDIPGKSKDHEVSEIGLLTELHIDPLPGVKVPQVSVAGMTEEAAEKPNFNTLGEIAVTLDDYNNNHVAFDAQHPFHRIYLILSDSSKASARKGLWKAGKKSRVVYHVELKDLYTIKNVEWATEDASIKKQLPKLQEKSLVKTNERFRVTTLDAERARITLFLSNEGFYEFIPDYIVYQLDTVTSPKEVNVKLTVLNQKAHDGYGNFTGQTLPHRKFYI